MFDALPEILVIRHGETEWNLAGRLQGRADSALTDKGRAQARALGIALRKMGIGPESHDMIVSPLGRTMATAAFLSAEIGGAARVDADLAEIDVGDWSGLSVAEIHARLPGVATQGSPLAIYDYSPAETLDMLWDRVERPLRRLVRPTVIVTHGVTSRLLRTRALGLPRDRIDDLPGGQGVIHRIMAGRHETLMHEGLHEHYTAANSGD